MTRRLNCPPSGLEMSIAQNTRKPQTVKADLAQRRSAAEERAKAQIEVLMAEMALRRCRDTAEALERLQMRTPLTFTTLADLMAPHPWAISHGVVLGHLLTMEEGVYRGAIDADNFGAVSLDKALRMGWADADEYVAWSDIYAETLREIAEEANRVGQAFRARQQLQEATAEAGGGETDGAGGRL